MTDKIFVVTETGFEYNDEVHSVSESGGGSPVAAYKTKAEALAVAEDLTIEFLKGWGGQQLGCFGYELDSIFNSKPSFVDMDDETFFAGNGYELEQIIDVKRLSDAELQELAKVISFAPYDITEIPLG